MAGEGNPIALMLNFIDDIARFQQRGIYILFRFGNNSGADKACAGGEMIFEGRSQHADDRRQDIGHRKIKALGKTLEQIGFAAEEETETTVAYTFGEDLKYHTIVKVQ